VCLAVWLSHPALGRLFAVTRERNQHKAAAAATLKRERERDRGRDGGCSQAEPVSTRTSEEEKGESERKFRVLPFLPTFLLLRVSLLCLFVNSLDSALFCSVEVSVSRERKEAKRESDQESVRHFKYNRETKLKGLNKRLNREGGGGHGENN
jgi:hypothetical protein